MSDGLEDAPVSVGDRARPDVHAIPKAPLASLWGALPGWLPRTLISPLLGTLTTTALVCLGYALAPSANLGWSDATVLSAAGALWLVTTAAWAILLRQPGRGWRRTIAELSTRPSLGFLDWLIWVAFTAGAVASGTPLGWLLAGLLTVSYVLLLVAPERDVALEESDRPRPQRARLRRTLDPLARPDERLSTEYMRVPLEWDMTPLGVPHRGSTELVVNLDRLHSMRRLNPERPGRIRGVPFASAAVNEWIIRGTTEEIDRLAVILSNEAADRGFTKEQGALLVLAVVQAIQYSLDIDSTGKEEYWRYPIETIADSTGDCEDTTILAASILRRMGYGVAMVFLPEHAALGIADLPRALGVYIDHRGSRYSYCETTAQGWVIGQLPEGFTLDDIKMIAAAPAESLAGVTGD
jgi:hypothetical protein